MRAIYWLYSIVKVYFFEQRPIVDEEEKSKIVEKSNEDDQEMADEGSPLVDLRND
jgi:hypothetical protein